MSVRSRVAWLVDTLGINPNRLTQKAAFLDRLKVQKAAFLLHYLGKQPFAKYNFNLYVNGPYSSELASDYYKINQLSPVLVNLTSTEREKFDWYVHHDAVWLEVASTILLISSQYPKSNRNEVHSILKMSKPWVSESYFNTIFDEIAKKDIFR